MCRFSGQTQQQLLDAGVGVAVDGGAGVDMMVMDSLDPTLLQMKTEVSVPVFVWVQQTDSCSVWKI